MTNELRVSIGLMESDAKNLTIGAIGDFYEVFFRNWKINNIIATPMVTINNNMLPDVNMYSASLFRKFDLEKIYFFLKNLKKIFN